MINKSKRVLAWVMTLMMAVVFIPCMSFAADKSGEAAQAEI